MGRLTSDEVLKLVRAEIFAKAVPSIGNWITLPPPSENQRMFFSQCKPSRASKGHWTYDFFHTISIERIQEIVAFGCNLILINYVDGLYCALGADEIVWLCTYSSRDKSNQGRVIDIVINHDREKDGYFMRPYDRMGKERKSVEVVEFGL